MYRFFPVIFLAVFSLAIPYAWKEARGPGVQKWQSRLLPEVQAPPEGNILKILKQPFFYWTKGSQCDVFLSEDGRHVLKIPRSSKRKFFAPAYSWKPRRPPMHAVGSFKAAGSGLMRETGSLYIHYGKSPPFQETVLYDRLGRKMRADLNKVPFALQQKRALLSEELDRHPEEAKELLLQWMRLIEREHELGWTSLDYAFAWNFGVADGEIIRIDVAGYSPATRPINWEQAAKPVLIWLEKHNPSLCEWFKERVREKTL